MIRPEQIRSDIVLVGGGHAHVHVLKAFAMRPEAAVRLTLIARDLETPYSGMLPGVVAGLYEREQAEIDLVRLASATGARLIHAEAVGIDREHKRVLLAGRAPIAYDILSIDVGIVPDLASVAGAAEYGIAVKPIGSFLSKFDSLIARCKLPDGPRRIAVIGGGAGGVELLLSVRSRILAETAAAGSGAAEFSFALITAGEILETHNRRVRDAFRRVFAQRGVKLYEHRRVRELTPNTVGFDDGPRLEIDVALVTTGAAGPAWLRETGLALDSGFLATGPTLQTLNDPDVFAVGDCAVLVGAPREKAGVFAVRVGAPLTENLRRHVLAKTLKSWHPQRRHLALISTGERYAVASRGPFKAEGGWVWKWKDWIDRRWMRMYQDVDRMMAQMSAWQSQVHVSGVKREEMRCRGCGAKIGPGPLSRVLLRLSPEQSEDIIVGLDAPDDAAVTVPTEGKSLVQTVDFFPAFIDDPYLLGEIAANHALNDVFAMAGEPRYALATVVVPPGPASKVEEELFQLLSGARACLDREDVELIGGHSSEGAEVAIGLSVTGEVRPDRIVRKAGLKANDALVLTKPLGTGILFAAAMRARAKAPWVAMALSEMSGSNRAAARLLIAHGVTAMTDITGFGLAGHLGEMLLASSVGATLDLASIPLYDGVLTLAREGVASTLLAENLAAGLLPEDALDQPTKAVLFDPQTSGGLLAGIPSDRVAACVAELRASGYDHATIIGRVVTAGSPGRKIAVRVSPSCFVTSSSNDRASRRPDTA
jgi:selenide,water dikinase